MTERTGILGGGSWIVDHVKMVDRYPDQDTLASILSESAGTGGAPYNVLVDLAKLGAGFPLSGVGLVGRDEDGQAILRHCAELGVDTAHLAETDRAGTSYTDVMTVQSTGRRTFFHMRGANALLDESHFQLETSSARILHLGYLLLLDRLDVLAEDGTTGASRVLRAARAKGFKTSVDVVSEDGDRFAALVTPALPHIDYLVINEIEAGRTTGIEVSPDGNIDWSRISEAAQRLLALGVQEWVVIHFPDGALARHVDGGEARQGSVQFPTDRIVGTAGAGDAFAAGLLYGLHDEEPIEDCLRYAVCAAAANLTDSTCTAGLKPMSECLEAAAELGFRPAG